MLRLMCCPVFLLFALAGPLSGAADQCRVYFGTLSTGPGHGIYTSTLDRRTGALSGPELAAETSDPGFIAISPDRRFLYALGGRYGPEQILVDGRVKAYAIDAPSGRLTLVNERATGDPEPCFITTDPAGGFVLTANYNGGSVAAYRIGDGGAVGERTAFARHAGSGPVPVRQEASHAHCINLDGTGRFALVADLGLDKVFIFRFDPATGGLSPNDPPFARMPAGSGPRHIAFHPSGKFAYSVNELDSTVAAFSWDGARGVLTPIQVEPLLPSGFSGQNTAAEIAVHPTGRFLYASNRGDDSIVVFAIDPASGLLAFRQRMAGGIRSPRSFALDPTGAWLVCGNLTADNASVFRIDPASGRLIATGRAVAVPQVSCVQFMETAAAGRQPPGSQTNPATAALSAR